MEPAFDEIWTFTVAGVIGALAVTVVATLLVVALVAWAVRRAGRPGDDPAVAELKRRLAAGEIDPVEYEVRIRELEDEG